MFPSGSCGESGPSWRRFGPHHGRSWAPPWAGAGWPFTDPPGRRRGRGDVRLAILGVLADGPAHGYSLIGEIGQRSAGSWRVSPGSVYPTLSALEDDGLVASREVAGRRVFELTDTGVAYVEEHADLLTTLWARDDDGASGHRADYLELLMAVARAAMQVASEGDETAREHGAELLETTRRRLYGLLSAEPASPSAPDEEGTPR